MTHANHLHGPPFQINPPRGMADRIDLTSGSRVPRPITTSCTAPLRLDASRLPCSGSGLGPGRSSDAAMARRRSRSSAESDRAPYGPCGAAYMLRRTCRSLRNGGCRAAPRRRTCHFSPTRAALTGGGPTRGPTPDRWSLCNALRQRDRGISKRASGLPNATGFCTVRPGKAVRVLVLQQTSFSPSVSDDRSGRSSEPTKLSTLKRTIVQAGIVDSCTVSTASSPQDALLTPGEAPARVQGCGESSIRAS